MGPRLRGLSLQGWADLDGCTLLATVPNGCPGKINDVSEPRMRLLLYQEGKSEMYDLYDFPDNQGVISQFLILHGLSTCSMRPSGVT